MTESPYSVDPGHVQIEMDLGVTTHDREGRTRTDGLNLAASNIRLGLLPRVDFQIVLVPLTMQRERVERGSNTTAVGFGDTTLRLKVNLFGNDGGNVALGILPFVSLRTASRAALRAPRSEFGLALPLAAALPFDIGLGAMPQVQLVVGQSGGYVPQFVETFTLGHAIAGDLAGFGEIASTMVVDHGAHPNLELHGGLTLAVGDSVQLDCGLFAKVAGPGDDLLAFLGLTFKR